MSLRNLYKKRKAQAVALLPNRVQPVARRAATPVPIAVSSAVAGIRRFEKARGKPLQARDLRSGKTAAAVGAAGSAGAFAGTAKAVGKTGKAAYNALPAPVRRAAAPAVGFVAGVAAVPLAARYAPGATARLGVGALKGGAAAATRVRSSPSTAGGAAGVARPQQPVRPDDPKPRVGGRSRAKPRNAPRAARKARRSPGASRRDGGRRRRNARRGGGGRTVDAEAGARRRQPAGVRGRGRGSARGGRRGPVRGDKEAALELAAHLEAQGWEVTLSPRG